MKRSIDLSVYLITDRDLCGARSVLDTVRQAMTGGLAAVQLRDPFARTGALVDEARALADLLKPAGIAFTIADRVDVALAADADGVHLVDGDMSPADARALIGEDRILGLSITSDTDFDASDFACVDHLAVGPTYPSLFKPAAARPMAIGGLAAITKRTDLPIVAIGGLHAGNAADAIAAGAAGVAVVSAICGAADVAAATRELREVVDTALTACRQAG